MTLKKNISPVDEDTQLLALFKIHFRGFLNLARIRLICSLITSLCKVKSVNYTKLSLGFDGKAETPSNYRRIQRFMSGVELPQQLVARLIFNLLPDRGSLVLVMDRTNWKFGQANINILMLGVSYKNVAFPLMFRMLDKRGNSSTAERIALMQDFINWFGKDCIDCLLADREFIGEQWLDFLNTNSIRYYIRIRNNFKIYSHKQQKQITAWHLFNNMKIGELRHYNKIVTMHGQLCYLSGMKTIKDGKIDYCIVVCFNKPDMALEYYSKRWQIETLFKGLKSSGFNIEDTHVKALERLQNLILIVMIAFVWCYKIGDFLDIQIRPIKIKKHGNRAVSIFKYGLDFLSRVLLSGFNKLNISVFSFLSCT